MGCQQSVEANANKHKRKELLKESFRRNRRTKGSGTVWINTTSPTCSSSHSSHDSRNSNHKKKRLRYAYLTQRGYYPDDLEKVNQDEYSITETLGGVDGECFFAVYDGHGPKGHEFSTYAKNHLPELLAKHVENKKNRVVELKDEEYEEASKEAHVECNNAMIESEPPLDAMSGTTAISVAFHSGHITISNVGDSRCILGSCDDSGAPPKDGSSSPILPVPLSRDQTPWRKDERERIIKAGGRILTIDQISGADKSERDFGNRILGEGDEVDAFLGDPPRVWLQDKPCPGTSFSRSLGDSIANRIGVCAEPECFSREISDQDEVLILASDGVFDFLPNKAVLDCCMKYKNDPVLACESVVDASYEQWLTYLDRTDDITVIIIFIDHDAEECFVDHAENTIVDVGRNRDDDKNIA